MITGIYAIRCIPNEKSYVGSAIDIEKRWINHKARLKRSAHQNMYLQRSWDKYGADAFLWEILEQVKPDKLVEREQHFIDKLKSNYRECGFNLTSAFRPIRGNCDTGTIFVSLPRATRDGLEAAIGFEGIKTLTDAVIYASKLLAQEVKDNPDLFTDRPRDLRTRIYSSPKSR